MWQQYRQVTKARFKFYWIGGGLSPQSVTPKQTDGKGKDLRPTKMEVDYHLKVWHKYRQAIKARFKFNWIGGGLSSLSVTPKQTDGKGKDLSPTKMEVDYHPKVWHQYRQVTRARVQVLLNWRWTVTSKCVTKADWRQRLKSHWVGRVLSPLMCDTNTEMWSQVFSMHSGLLFTQMEANHVHLQTLKSVSHITAQEREHTFWKTPSASLSGLMIIICKNKHAWRA